MFIKSPLISFVQESQVNDVRTFHATINPTSAIIQDHRVKGHSIISGSFWLECIQQAFAYLEKPYGQIRNLVWISPCVVNEKPVVAKLTFKQNNSDISVNITSHMNSQVVHHATATIKITTDHPVRKNRLSIKTIQDKSTLTIDSGDIYQQFSIIGFQYGPSYQLIKKAYCSTSSCLSELMPIHDADQYRFHPGIVDAALQSCLGIAYVNQQPNKAYLPLTIKGIKTYGVMDQVRFIYAIINPVASKTVTSYHLFFLDEQGEILVFMNDFMGRQLGE